MTPEQAIVLIEALFEWEDFGEQTSRRRNAHVCVAIKAVNPLLNDDRMAYSTYHPIITKRRFAEKSCVEREKFADFLQDWSRALRMSFPNPLEK
jgi:hypothetical protein